MSSQFRRACAQWATGIAVVTATDIAGVPHGMTVNSFTSVSLDPPLISVCVDHRAAILPSLSAGSKLAINVLAENQTELSSRFASKIEDRFENFEWTRSSAGNPILTGTLATFECTINQSITAGDHQIVVAAVDEVTYREGRPLIYFNSGYEELAG